MSMLEAALAFAGRGCPCFPCRPMDKRPATPNGFKDATLDEDIILDWFGDVRMPAYNLAVPTGIVFDVLDVDGVDGANALEEWIDRVGANPRFYEPTVLTPSGGYHIYRKPTGRGNKVGMLPHVDYRGLGGYVLVPPSRTERGEYRWF